MTAQLDRTKDNPWVLRTPPGTSEYTMHLDERDGVRVLVCTVGTTTLYYDARCIDDLYAMLKAAGDWVELGGADEQKPAKEGTVEAWGRSPEELAKEVSPGVTFADVLESLAVHNAYHLGKVAALRQAIGAWPPGTK